MKQSLRMLMLFVLSVGFMLFSAATNARAATYTVDTTADNAALTACTDAPNDCSLRGAISSAPAGATVTFGVTGTITLTGGDITITKNLTINGPASAPGITVSGNNANRIFNISGGTVALSALTLSGGNEKGLNGGISGYGGGVYIGSGTLTVDNCTVSGNTAGYNGGGIYNAGGTVTVTGSTISGNFAYGTSGGIHNSAGTLMVLNSTISGNTANNTSEPSGGGGISNYSGGILTVTSSTLTNNNSGRYGGGIYNNSGTVTMTNSTVSGNHANDYRGGGIYNGGTLNVTSSTIFGNSAFSNGGGISNSGAGSTLNLSDSIVAGNGAGSGPDIYGTVASGDYNLVQNTAGATLSGSHNITGLDPQLDTLKNNGGPTATMALKAGSYAINTGDPNFDTAAIPYDQRGSGFPRKVSSAVDIGAFESNFTTHALLASNLSFSGSRNVAFSGQLTVSGGDPGNTLTYSIVSGTLPAGLTLDSATGIISGTPTAYGSSTLTYKATDNNGGVSNTATVTINITETLSLVVNTLSDTTANDELTSLREAVAYANSGNAGANPVITFSVTGTIEMNEPSLSITRDMTITGPGAGSLTLSGNGNANRNIYAASIFNISGGVVNISGLTLRDGTGTSVSNTTYGGAIYMTGGTVTVTGSTFSNNNYAQYGGAIYVGGGSLAVTSSTISNNTLTAYNYGGGIAIGGGSVAINNSTISGNTAGFGAGIYSVGGMVNVTNSTVSGNTARNSIRQITIICSNRYECENPPPGFTCVAGYIPSTCTGTVSDNGRGGGILNLGGTVNVTNSTISGNTAQGYDTFVGDYGGGIDNRSALTIANSTITKNLGSYGGGILNRGTLNLSNTIVAGNIATHDDTPDTFNYPNSSTSGNYNLVQNGNAVTGTGNITGQDAKLGALANNGGPTQTHALLAGSPAIDAGDPNFDLTNTPYDQRGPGFPRVKNGRLDIGAYESSTPQSGSSFVVNTLADYDDGECGVTDCTLREAVKYAPEGTTITFSVTGTITLTQGEITINKYLTITGPAAAPGITVSGNNSSRIFYINIVSNSGKTLNLSALTLSGGNGVGSVGSGNGGAVYIDSSSTLVTIRNCTISGNTASGNAGAIRGANATLTITNSTISGNTAAGANSTAGGLRISGIVNIANSTISGNTAVNGGGIYYTPANAGYTLTLTNSIVAGNTATTAPDIYGTVAGGDYNLVQNTSNISGATLSGTHNITGQDPKLGALTTDNGGPTATMALLSGSPAIDAGDPSFVTTNTPYDQRGSGYARKVGSAIDIGAFEVQPPPAPADLTIVKSHTGNFTQSETGKTYTITVTNSGGTASSGSISITDSLPSGLTATGISGAGWTCNQATLTCTRTDALAAAGSYPAITLTVSVAANAPASVTNTATVSGGGESNTANNTAFDATTINAAATYSISGQVIYGTPPTGSAARGVPGVVFDASGTPSATAASNLSGIYQLSGLGSGAYTVTPSKSGDANHITANDALLVQQYGAYATDLTANQLIAADTNGDNLINATDALYIQQYLAYVNTATANIIEQWKFLPASRNYTLSSNQTNQNYTAVLVGEVDGDWVAPGGTTAPLQTASAANESEDAANANETNADETNSNDINDTNVNQMRTEKPRRDGQEATRYSSPLAPDTAAAVSSVTVSLPTNATSSTGTSVTIPITVSQLPALTDANVVKTYAFNVQYDATVLQFTGFDTTSTLSGSGVVCGQPPADATNNRIVACNYTNLNGITGQGTLLKLNFTVIGTSRRQSALTFIGTARQPNPFIFNTGDPQAATANGGFMVTTPTAAAVSVGGRVLTASGKGISGVRITLTDLSGDTKTAVSTAFGYYRFDNVPAGSTYIFTAKGKRYEFSQPTQVVNVNEDTFDINFTANPLSKNF